MNLADMSFLELFGLSTIVVILMVVAAYITSFIITNTKRFKVYKMIMDLDNQDLELLERILNEF